VTIIAIVVLLSFVVSVLYVTGRISGPQAMILGIFAVVSPVISTISIRRRLRSWGLLEEPGSDVPASGQGGRSSQFSKSESGVETTGRAQDQTRPASAARPPLCRQRVRGSSSFRSFHSTDREPRPVELVTTSSEDRR
jgi:hypothetical protein